MSNLNEFHLDTAITIIETPQSNQAESFLEIFYEREKYHPNKVFLRQPKGNKWQEFTWKEIGTQARIILSALQAQGLKKGDHIGILSKNCYEWFIADLAILMGGYISVPFYPTLPGKDLQDVINRSHIKLLFIGKLENWEDQKMFVPHTLPSISFPHYPGNCKIESELQWKALFNKHKPAEKVYQPSKNDIFTIIFTSGTTGESKGVMLNYDSINRLMLQERNRPVYGVYQGVSEKIISYLPLNHIAERVASEITSIVAGSVVSFSESIEQFSKNLHSVQPTLFFAVPRIWCKIQEAIQNKLPQKRLDLLLSIPLVNKFIANKIRKTIGLGSLRSAISGAAPIPHNVIEWFSKIGINIQEVYGATELCGGVAYNPIDDISPGTVGSPIPGTVIKIHSESNEILVRTPWVMKGYYDDFQKTQEVFIDGFYKTGDLGYLDKNGRLVVTGRLNDTFKTSKGKFIIPAPIEIELGKNRMIEHIMITGFGLAQPIALICLTEPAYNLTDASIESQLLDCLNSVNKHLENHTIISTIVVFRYTWPEGGRFFTPTLKLKRFAVNAAFKSHYQQWSDSSNTIIWTEL